MRKLLSLMIAVTLVMGLGSPIANAATRPAKVKGISTTKTSVQITLKWKKAKGAKKYQVYKHNGKKYVKIATTKKRKVTVKKLKPNRKYKFRIRAINDKRKGKFSKVIKVKTRKPIKHKGTANPASTKFVVGDTYSIKNGQDTINVKITDYHVEDGKTEVNGTSPAGGEYHYYKNNEDNKLYVIFEEKGYTKHFELDDWELMYTDFEDYPIRNTNCYRLNVKNDNTKAYWTLDGTEPKIGQADLIGYSKYCILDRNISGFSEMQRELYNNAFGVKDGNKLKSKLRGTGTKATTSKTRTSIPVLEGQSIVGDQRLSGLVGAEPCENFYTYVKVYNGTELIYELIDNYK